MSIIYVSNTPIVPSQCLVDSSPAGPAGAGIDGWRIFGDELVDVSFGSLGIFGYLDIYIYFIRDWMLMDVNGSFWIR
jgi:hypothetical protein